MSPPDRQDEASGRSAALSSVARGTARTVALVARTAPKLLALLAALTIASGLLPVAIAFAGKHLVDAVVARSAPEATRWVLVEAAIVAASALVARGLTLTRQALGSRLGVDINVAILERALRLELSDFEDADTYDRMTRARREASSRPVATVSEAFRLVESLLTLASYSLVLVQFGALWVVLLLAATVPATLAEMRFAKIAFRLRNWRSPESRKLLYLEHVLANDEHVKEVKVYGLGSHLLERYRGLAEKFHDEDMAIARRRALVTQLWAWLATGVYYGAYFVVAMRAAAGAISVGTMTLFVMALRQGQQAFQAILGSVGALYEHDLYLSNLYRFLDDDAASDPASAPAEPRARLSAPRERGAVVRFEDVGFRYAGTDTWALRHVDVELARGQSVALVGQNGAGKSTFVKLLLRLYEPTEGRILLDGRDLREWDREDLFKRVAAVFQDFNRYKLSYRENVAFGSLPDAADDARVARATERSGASELLSGLSRGEGTVLGRWFRDGVELSGGQWQKVALARAFMREEADVLVLDEPSAALDAEAEHALFQRIQALSDGKTTILISHRFSTVRSADRILVFEGGRVLEDGTHDALVALGGTYARLYAIQAEGYR